MDLQYFPMDRQLCTIEIESCITLQSISSEFNICFTFKSDGYSMADIMYKWGIDGKGSVGISDQVQLPQFKVKGLKQHQKTEYLSTGQLFCAMTCICIEYVFK